MKPQPQGKQTDDDAAYDVASSNKDFASAQKSRKFQGRMRSTTQGSWVQFLPGAENELVKAPS